MCMYSVCIYVCTCIYVCMWYIHIAYIYTCISYIHKYILYIHIHTCIYIHTYIYCTCTCICFVILNVYKYLEFNIYSCAFDVYYYICSVVSKLIPATPLILGKDVFKDCILNTCSSEFYIYNSWIENLLSKTCYLSFLIKHQVK